MSHVSLDERRSAEGVGLPCSVRPRRRCPAEKQGLRFHDLRHTCATLLIAAGAHVYEHILPCTEAALVDAVDAIYEQCDEGDDAAAAQGS